MPEIIKVVSTTTPIKVISNLIPGPTGATGAAGPNTVTSATTSDGTCDLSVSSLTGSITISNGKHIHVNNGGLLDVKSGATFEIKSGATITLGDPSAFRTALGLGTAATTSASAYATASHTHGNISNAGAIGTSSGMVVTTTTAGVLTTSSRSGIDSRDGFPSTLEVESLPTNSISITINGDEYDLEFTQFQNGRPQFFYSDGTTVVTLQYDGAAWNLTADDGDPFYVATNGIDAQLPWEITQAWDTSGEDQPIFNAAEALTTKRLTLVSGENLYQYDGIFKQVLTADEQGYSVVGGGKTIIFENDGYAYFGSGGVASFYNGGTASFSNGSIVDCEGASFNFDSTSAESLRNAAGGLVGADLMAADTTTQAAAALGVISRRQSANSATRNSTTYTTSTELTSISLSAGVTYNIIGRFSFAAGTTAGIKIRLVCANMQATERIVVASPATPTTVTNSGNNIEIIATTSAFTSGFGVRNFRGEITPTVNTTLTVEWATNATPSGGDTAQMLAPSYIYAIPLPTSNQN